MMHKHTMNAYLRLMRVDRPIGTLLLLWPTLCALWLASGGTPTVHLLFVFILGVFLTRSAGCVINDYIDRHIDGQVHRTRLRPLPQGEVSLCGCRLLLLILIVAAFLLVLTLNYQTLFLSAIALVLTFLYPFAKRIIILPQLILGLAFSWPIPMAFTAITGQLSLPCGLLLLATFCWIIAYDTQYALLDRADDLKLGLYSTAVLWGERSGQWIAIFQLNTLLLLLTIGWYCQLAFPFYLCLICVAILFWLQQRWIAKKTAIYYLKAFISNNYVGLIIFLGLLLALR